MQRSNFSRRSLLKGLGIGALGVGMGVSLRGRALAQTTPSSATIGSVYRFTLGAFELAVIQDGTGAFPPGLFAVNAPEGTAESLLESSNLPSALLNSTLNVLMVDTGDRRVLFDAGQGGIPLDDSGTPSNTGKLIPTLEALGTSADDITDVVITHFHPDHVAGLLIDGAPAFPNATYHISQAELDFLQSPPAGVDMLMPFIDLANTMIAPISANGQLEVFAGEDEIISGIQAIAAPGHTPGHTAFLLASQGAQLLHMLDTANNAVISLSNPDYVFGFDTIPDLASQTRRALLTRAADEQLQVLGYHFPFPGLGYISSAGDGFRWTAFT